MIRHTYQRAKGGPRYGPQQRRAAREAQRTGAAATLTAAAVAAMTSPDGIQVVADVLFELESNRLQRPATVEAIVDGSVVASGATGGDVGTSLSPQVSGLLDGQRRSDLAYLPPGATSSKPPTIRIKWPEPRRINVVEVPATYGGNVASGQTTNTVTDASVRSARVWTIDANGVETLRGDYTSSGLGDLACQIAPYDAPIECYGISVLMLTWNAPSQPPELTEVDAMLILDVSDQVIALELENSRETDPTTTPNPVGSFEASTVTFTLDDTDGRWNPLAVPSLDVGHRVEVAIGVVVPARSSTPEELMPGGVFFTDPFDTDSTSGTVTITGVDRLGRNTDLELAEPVGRNQQFGLHVRQLCDKYLGSAVVSIPPAVGASVIPFTYPSGQVGTYIADLAKAFGMTVNVDPLDQVVFARRVEGDQDTPTVVSADTSLIDFRRPNGYDLTKSVVNVTASPLSLGVDSELWAMPSGGVTIPAGGSYQFFAEYSEVPAVNVAFTGAVADGRYSFSGATYLAERASVIIVNLETSRALVVADLRVRGTPLIETPLAARREHRPSVLRYGPRSLEVAAKMIQTQAQLDLTADVLMEAYRSLADDGTRRLPDLNINSLGLIHLTNGDQVRVVSARNGMDAVYTILARKTVYQQGSMLLADVRLRQTSAGETRYVITDSGHLTDDGRVTSY